MRSTRSTDLITSWPWSRRRGQPASTLTLARAGERVESYVYGNVLVLAALGAASLDAVETGRAALLILGTSFSTLVAHLMAVTVSYHARPDDLEGHPLRHSVRDALPIATSGIIPAIFLLVGWWGWLAAEWSLGLAIGTIVVRFMVFGSVVSHLKGEESTWKNAFIGFGLAAAGLIVAGIKFFLTH